MQFRQLSSELGGDFVFGRVYRCGGGANGCFFGFDRDDRLVVMH